MRMKILVSIGFVLHTVIVNIGMIPMTFPQGVEILHEEHLEMIMTPVEIMTPVVQMTSLNCNYCVLVQKIEATPVSTGCYGFCISAMSDSVASLTSGSPFAKAVSGPSLAIPSILASADERFSDGVISPRVTWRQGSVVLIE